MASKVIDLHDLKWLLCELVDALEKRAGSRLVSVDKDLYWIFPESRVHDMQSLPVDLDVGNLQDDIDFLKIAIDSGDFPGIPLAANILPVLQYLSNYTTPPKAVMGSE